ncbi:DedA family protein [Bailinhaonella thermotolerans]|uniref:DedA family protein n=2 Tax=Bailinhaonella thermotolerans TaxID=1070861 RepID=A0A3A4BX79_9ACTN|nr:DedA family protein [Bailinhaonella thermotolerans]
MIIAGEEPPVEAGGLVEWVIGLVETMGGPGAGLAIAAENLFPPIPSELILPLAGFTASRGQLGLVEAIVWCTVGSIVGALALYTIGRVFGRERIRAIVARLPLMKVSDVDKTEAWFAKHGGKAVFFGRMIPIFRSLISVPAGIEAMPVGLFLLLSGLGSLIWNTAFVLAGYLLGESWWLVEEYVGIASKAVVGLVLLAIAAFVFVRVRDNRRAAGSHRRSDDAVGS